MYASEDVSRAAHFLIRGLSAAFGIAEAQVWHAPTHEMSLRLVAYTSTALTEVEIPVTEDRLEARAYREAASLRGPETGQHVERALPLLTLGRRPIGVVIIHDSMSSSRFGEQRERELHMAGYLSQAARALEQVGKRTQELALAGRVQASLLPRTPSLPGWELTAVLRPARQTAGDFYDFIQLPAGRLGIVIADVADKGMGAALYMALSRTLVRTYAADYADAPEQVLRAASARMLSDAGAGMFVTVFYGILDPASGWLVYCNAGHNPPYLISAQAATAVRPLGRTGMALGVVEGATWHQEKVHIGRDDLLLLYTDGVVEAQNRDKELFGRDRLLEVVQGQAGRPAADTQAAVLAAVHDFAGSEAQFDDITLVLVRREPQAPEREIPMIEPRPGRIPGRAAL